MDLNDDGLCAWSDLPPDQCAHCKLVAYDMDDDGEPNYPPDAAHAGRLRVIYPVAAQPPTAFPHARQAPDFGACELVDYITVLCDPTIHYERYTIVQHHRDGSSTYVRQRHRTTSPPLLEQLWTTASEATGASDSGSRAGYASKPTARLDALDAARDIERGIFRWLTRLGERPDSMIDTIAALRHLGSLARAQPKPVRDELEAEVRSWWSHACVLTGWESPAWSPRCSCPLCGTRGSIRIKLEHETAVCVDCHETWHPETIGLLAEHIRTENNDNEETAS